MENGGIVSPFLTLTLDGGEWAALLPGRFTPLVRTYGTHWIGGWVGPYTVWMLERRKNPDSSVFEHVG
jgi:hypothetical protein